MNSHPKYKYHADFEPIVVEDEAEEAMLGDSWKNSPAEHGIITNPSKEQAHQARIAAMAKASKEPKQAKG